MRNDNHEKAWLRTNLHLGPDFFQDNTQQVTAETINSTKFPRAKKHGWPGRYFCQATSSGNAHCDERKHTIQCDHCIFVEKELRDNPDHHPTKMYLTKDERTAQQIMDAGEFFITDPTHGGKVTCHKCNGFIQKKDGKQFANHPNDEPFQPTWFHDACFNRYEHYYGLDKPVD